ncbi:peptidase [Kitasatospora sp. NPDC059673]|uniref:COG1470 family protein n=1 Tax=Kitasatospora sp. NPDC059673 TaxID=3346901 RepID=UPI0036B5C2EB
MKGARGYLVPLMLAAVVQAAAMTPAMADGMPSPAVGTAEHEQHGERTPEPGPEQRTIGIKLLDAPEDRRDDPRAQAYIVDHLAPGSTIERRVEVSNESSTPMHVDVYAAAAAITKGQFTFAPDRTPNELTGWTSLDTTGLDLAAHETAQVRATVQVPKNASAGERYGVIWAQTGRPEDRSAQAGRPADRSHNLTILGRVGVRMYLDVGPGGEPASDFEIEQLTPARGHDGRAELHARVRNTGGRALDIGGTLALSDGPGGLRAGPFSARTGTALAPGESADAVVPLDTRVPEGPWNVELALRSGVVEHSARATVTFPVAPGGTGAVTASAARAGSFPTPLVGGLSVLALAAVGLLLPKFRRRSRR